MGQTGVIVGKTGVIVGYSGFIVGQTGVDPIYEMTKIRNDTK